MVVIVRSCSVRVGPAVGPPVVDDATIDRADPRNAGPR
jgi:hypothetical protein